MDAKILGISKRNMKLNQHYKMITYKGRDPTYNNQS